MYIEIFLMSLQKLAICFLNWSSFLKIWPKNIEKCYLYTTVIVEPQKMRQKVTCSQNKPTFKEKISMKFYNSF